MNEFKTYHPIVNFLFFALVVVFSCILMHPVCLLISLICSFVYSSVLGGAYSIKTKLTYLLPMIIVAAVMNPAFNHEGITILAYLPSGNPLTLESVIYGICAAVVLASVICWFSCYNAVMTSDKFIYLFGKIMPSLSSILSMTLRFVPKFISQFKVVRNAQKCVGRDISNGNILQRTKNAVTIFSIMITWALESSVETADSMKARGYGLSGRTAFSNFKISKRDLFAVAYILILACYIIAAYILGAIDFRYFPSMVYQEISFFGISAYAAYFMFCLMPVIIEVWEVQRWKALKLKI